MEKNYSLSLIRFIGTAFVIFCHVFEQSGYRVIGNYLSVGVQMFLLLSGYLYSKKEFYTSSDRIEFIIKNFIKILVDYYICVLLFFIPAYCVIKPEYISMRSLFNILTCSGAWWGVHHLWYIPYCLFCYLITPILYDIRNYFKRRSSILLIIGLAVSVELLFSAYHSYFMPCWIICYCIGYFLPDLLKINTPLGGAVCISAAVLNTLRFFYRYVWDKNAMGKLENLIYDKLSWYACVFLGLLIFLTLLRLSKNICWPDRIKKLLNISDTFSYDVYLVHMIFVKGCLSFIGRCGNFMTDSSAVLIVSCIGGAALHWISVRVKRNISSRALKNEGAAI